MTLSELKPLFLRVREIMEAARDSAARSVNSSQVIAYWLIGREIVLEEQKGRSRAEYGKRVLATLSRRMTKAFGIGFSIQNLSYMRQFYLVYARLLEGAKILHAVRGESGHDPIGPAGVLKKERG
jgi:hypothetical protein